MEGHNTWCVNRPGSTLVIPVADIAQHLLLILCFLVQNGYCIFNDVHGEKIPGMEKFRGLVDVDNPFPLTFIEQYALTEATAELSTACYAGMLMLQALGLGGWMFDGIDRFSLLGASGKAEVPGLGFQYQTRPDWVLPHITGRPGVFESYTPPHFPNMRAAVDALVQRKFSTGGPFHLRTPGPWKESSRVRSSAQMHSEVHDCVATMASTSTAGAPRDRAGGVQPDVSPAHHTSTRFCDEKFQPLLPASTPDMEWHGARPSRVPYRSPALGDAGTDRSLPAGGADHGRAPRASSGRRPDRDHGRPLLAGLTRGPHAGHLFHRLPSPARHDHALRRPAMSRATSCSGAGESERDVGSRLSNARA
jgi:hypothetical protein